MSYSRKRTNSYGSKKRYGYSRKWGQDEYRPAVMGFIRPSEWEKKNGRVFRIDNSSYPITRKKRR